MGDAPFILCPMRTRWTILSLLAVVAVLLGAATAAPSLAQPAGDTEEESESGTTSGEDESEQAGDTEEGTGQDDPAAETGAGEGGSEEAATETGPPWTYQMARIALVLLLFLGLSVGLMYWRLVASRQRGTA